MKKHLVALGLIVALLLLISSTFLYPGGSQLDKNSVGYDWTNNYLCNLFNEKAINGAPNPARLPAALGMFALCGSYALFFWRFSEKIPSKVSARIIRYSGLTSMICAFLVITPYHDTMTTLASVLALVTLYYVLYYTFKSKLTVLKYLSIVCIVILYLNNYIYYTRSGLAYLPVLQKVSFLTIIGWLLGLEYATTKDDFVKTP